MILRKNAGEAGGFSQKGPRFFRESVVYWEKRIRKGRITGWNCGRTGVHPSFALQLSLLLSSVSYLFRLLRVRMIYIAVPLETAHSKRPCSREHGQRWNDLPSESPYGRERTCSHGVLCLRPCGFVSAEAVPYRTEGNSTRVKLSFYYYLEKNRKIGRSKIVNFL